MSLQDYEPIVQLMNQWKEVNFRYDSLRDLFKITQEAIDILKNNLLFEQILAAEEKIYLENIKKFLDDFYILLPKIYINLSSIDK